MFRFSVLWGKRILFSFVLVFCHIKAINIILCSFTCLGSIRLSNCSVFFFSMSSCSVLSRISSSRLFEYFSNISNIVSTKFTFLEILKEFSVNLAKLKVSSTLYFFIQMFYLGKNFLVQN